MSGPFHVRRRHLLIALAVRLLHIWQLKSTPYFDTLLGDAGGYDKWAMRLASGDWIGSDVFYQAPLYPYFLGIVYAIFGRDLLIVRIIQALVGSASCVLVGLACARLFSPPSPGLRWPGKRVGLVAGLALALWAPAIFSTACCKRPCSTCSSPVWRCG